MLKQRERVGRRQLSENRNIVHRELRQASTYTYWLYNNVTISIDSVVNRIRKTNIRIMEHAYPNLLVRLTMIFKISFYWLRSDKAVCICLCVYVLKSCTNHNYCMYRWPKNDFENRLIFGKVKAYKMVPIILATLCVTARTFTCISISGILSSSLVSK